jgi:hypothetical protein
MKAVVQDASVLIDLAAGDLLEAWFSLRHLNPRLSKKECEPLLAKWRNP